jgi:glucose-1-phosphate cytidylyltransferase
MTIHNNAVEPWRVTLVDTGTKTQTGGRLKRIAPYVEGETFMLTYGDGVSNVALNDLLEQHKSSGMVATLTAVQPSGRFGVLDLDEDKNCVLGFREKIKEDSNWINAGFMVMEPGVFKYLDGDSCVLERKPLENMSSEQKLGVFCHFGFWMCMDTQRDRAALEEMWKNGNTPWKVWK